MKKLFLFLAVLVLVTFSSGMALATGFYAITNELGYQGTIWNITVGTGPWETSTPRNANLFTVVDAPQIWSDSNELLSSWFEHLPSNQNDSFLQLYDETESVTGAVGGWDSTLQKFTITVKGQDAPYPYSRFWQPDNGVAWGVTFTEYLYTFEATFSTAAYLDSYGFYVNSSAPDTIVGSFVGEFQVTYDVNKNPITNGDTYGFGINFNKAWFDSDLSNFYEGTGEVYNEFGAQASVPEPATLLLLGSGLVGLAGFKKSFRKR